MPGATFLIADAFAAAAAVVSDGVMNAVGPNTRLLSSATAVFKRTDVGKKIVVQGAGASGADLTTSIARWISATQVELKDPALTTVASADLTYVLGRYRLSDLINQGDVDGNHYQIMALRRLNLQVNGASPGGKIYVGGPYVTPTNAGIELGTAADDNTTIGDRAISTTGEYVCSDMADQLLNVYWIDDLNQSTPA